MAIPKIKATYSLDRETVDLLERVARRWGVSKSEALRQAIRALASQPAAKQQAIAVLDRLQKAAGLDRSTAARWQRQIRSGRRAESRPR
jgi:Arc/MetJ-type ribon-helix-helix transcriptional regulator